MRVFIEASNGRAARELEMGALPRTGDIVDLEGVWHVVKGVIWDLGAPVPSVRLVIDRVSTIA